MPESAWTGPGSRRRPGRVRVVGRMALVKANRFATSTVVVRRECLEQCGGFEDRLALGQDWDMWLRIAERWEVAMLPAALTCYRLHDGQRSARSLKMRGWEVEVVRRAMARGPRCGRAQRVARRRLAWAHYRLGRALLREGRRGAGVEALRASVHLDPLGALAWARLARCWLSTRRGDPQRSPGLDGSWDAALHTLRRPRQAGYEGQTAGGQAEGLPYAAGDASRRA